jgi:Ras GTPase-activating protein 1
MVLQEWLQALKPYCLNTKPRRSNNLTDVPTEVRSLYIKIFEAKRLPLKQLPHPYCIVALNDMKLCRTQAKDSPDPCWDEEFLIE